MRAWSSWKEIYKKTLWKQGRKHSKKMLSLEHYNEEIARLVSALQIETGKFPNP